MRGEHTLVQNVPNFVSVLLLLVLIILLLILFVLHCTIRVSTRSRVAPQCLTPRQMELSMSH